MKFPKLKFYAPSSSWVYTVHSVILAFFIWNISTVLAAEFQPLAFSNYGSTVLNSSLRSETIYIGPTLENINDTNSTSRWGLGNLDWHIVKNKSSVIFTLFSKARPRGEKIIIGKSDIRKTHFNRTNDLKIIVHGYTEFGHGINSMIPIRNAYRRSKTEVNVVVADWSLHSMDIIYPGSVSHVAELGQYIGLFIDYLGQSVNYKNLTKVHLIGFSLGAHVAGWTGRSIFQKTGEKIGRITGLDPAGPKFHQLFAKDRATTEDAQFFDVIHGDTDTFGGNFQGHVNFYPNGGRHQPGCGSIFGALIGCGHRKTPQWFAESIVEPRKFIGCRCSNYTDFKEKKCSCRNRNDLAEMGEGCNPNTRGTYFLEIKEGDLQIEWGIYPHLLTAGFSSNIQINNYTVPHIIGPLWELKPTLPPLRPPSLPAPSHSPVKNSSQ